MTIKIIYTPVFRDLIDSTYRKYMNIVRDATPLCHGLKDDNQERIV